MNHFEVDDCLRSMVILVDTREQDTKRARERYGRFPCDYVRQALSYGDYAYNFVLPDGKRFLEYSSHEVISPNVVERKMNEKTFRSRICQGKGERSEDLSAGGKCHLGEAFGREVQEHVQSSCIPGINPCMAEPL